MKQLDQKSFLVGLAIAGTVVIVAGAYLFVQVYSLSSKIDLLSSNMASLNANFASTTRGLQTTIDQSHTELSTEQQSVGAIQQQIGGVQNQVGTLSGTLTTLQKLSETDPELLEKYSKVFFLNENYVPARLSQIPLSYQYTTSKQLLFQTDALPHLLAMITSASSTGVQLYVSSAYRSFAEQRALKGEYSMTYGAGTANSFSADQGYSEHQLGTAVDLTTVGINGGLVGFDKTPAYQWMLQNAYQYGFIISYPKDNGYYVFEPWHWRFVGVKLATDLHNEGKNFYDLDQRTLDTYLVSIFD